MKEAFFKDMLRNIKKRFVSWLSIVVICFIGVGAILGIHSAAYSTEKYAAKFYSDHNFKDFDLASNFGVHASDIDEIKEVEGIVDAEGVISVSGQASYENTTDNTTIISVTERISVPYAIEGEMPDSPFECAISRELADSLLVAVGDTVSLKISTLRMTGILKEEEFLVTGICGHPDFVACGTENYCVVPVSSFDMSYLSTDYTNIFVDADASSVKSILSNEYFKKMLPLKEKLDKKTSEMADNTGCRWCVKTRQGSLHFLQLMSSTEVLANFFIYFSPMYMFVTTLVVFYTIVIIIEEQKVQIGTAKAR